MDGSSDIKTDEIIVIVAFAVSFSIFVILPALLLVFIVVRRFCNRNRGKRNQSISVEFEKVLSC
jgi:Flp pilus assembly protein TadB